jgi:hypothetical protein
MEAWEELIENAGDDDSKSKKQNKIIVRTEEHEELPLILNTTNANDLAEIFGSDDTDAWVGKKFLAYADKNIKFGKKKVGGLRVAAASRATMPAGPVDGDRVPF